MAIKTFDAAIITAVRVRAWAFFPEYLQGSSTISSQCSISCNAGKRINIAPSLTASSSQTVPTMTRTIAGVNSGNKINLQPQVQLGIRLPTGVTIDFAQLGIPFQEGVSYTFKLEDDFVRETEGNQSSLPARDLFSTRIPKQGLFKGSIVASLYNLYGRRRPFAITMAAFDNMAVKINYLVAKFAIFAPWQTDISTTPVKTARITKTLTAISSIIANNVKVLSSAVSTQSITASMTLPENWLVRLAQSSMSSVFNKTIDAFKYKGIVNEVLSNPVSLLTAPVKTARIQKTLSVLANQSAFVVKTVKPSVTMAAQSSLTCDAQGPMTLVYNTNLIAGNTITLPLNDSVNVTVDWGDGTTTTSTTATELSKTYSSKGIYTVKIYGTLTKFGRDTTGALTGVGALTQVLSFGQIGLTNLRNAFDGATNLTVVPDVLPTQITTLYGTFRNCTNFNGLIPNGNKFNSWNTANVNNLTGTFLNCTSFNTNISAWNVSAVTTMEGSFNGCISFNQPINWTTSALTNTNSAFKGCSAFNQSLSSWDMDSVTNAAGMFENATSFNQSLSSWNVSSLREFSNMFKGASAFNQNLGSWNLYSGGFAVSMVGMLDNCGMNTANYSSTLIGWEQRVSNNGGKPKFVTLGAAGRTYNSTAVTARYWLTQPSSGWAWTITGDSLV